ncbi:MAG: mechanosensitive ion channel family protein [Chloroflexi bacterium]|nr:mechanosensitive ion channel family protein [Chloroflexota bacterium]
MMNSVIDSLWRGLQDPTFWKALLLAIALLGGRRYLPKDTHVGRILRRALSVTGAIALLYAVISFGLAAFNVSAQGIIDLGTRILLVVLLGYFAWEGIELFLAYLAMRIPATDELTERRLRTITEVGRWIGRGVVIFVVGTMLLSIFKIEITPLIASAGVVGLALGLGSQKLIQDIIAGVFILLEDQFHVGDGVEVAGITGVVEDMTLRVTKVRDLHGYLHIIPNSEITVVTNRSRGWTRAIAEVGVAYDSDLDKVKKVLTELGQTLYEENPDNLFLEPPFPLGPEALADSSINFRLVARVQPDRQWDAERLMRQRIKEAFDRAGIEIPFPQLDVHMRG